MKFLVPIILVVLAPAVGAQEAGTRLLDRTTGMPDMEKQSSMQGKPFEGAGKMNLGKAGGFDRSAGVDGSFQTGSYTMTRSFFGIKNPWLGGKVVDIKPANTTTDFVIPNLQRQFDTKDLAGTRPAFDADRSANLREEPVKTKEHVIKAGAQGAMDVFGEQTRKEMSIEDIREILNKK
ncbi:MAG: hypothetical protein WEB60_11835 [Terrimicrobiaceae bacterium]